MGDLIPVTLERGDEGELSIRWNDGVHQRISVRHLRDACPCASCLEKARARETSQRPGQLPVLAPADTMPLQIMAMEPAGRYGYTVRFSDGHSSGIYSLEILRALG